ncbi:putative bromodomain-containing protein 10 [Pelodytes ibericus]
MPQRELVRQMQRDIGRLRAAAPEIQIVWSEIVPRITWRNLSDKSSIVVTCKEHCGVEDDKGAIRTSTRRRSSTRNLANINTGTVESLMVLKQEELQKTKEEKRLREQEKKKAEETSQKEVEEWDKSLLALAEPSCMETMWEIPAIGHFLCLAQQILNLPEIVFYELERCLLMPQYNVFLSKIMTSLLSPPHRRTTLHRRVNLPYQAWEAALRQKVQQWYTIVGQAENPDRCAEKLGLCSQFFNVLGEVNPLEQKAFHELPFYQKVWLLKGLCDFVYETQSEVQDAVLGQPIHECREVILGYDAQENAYIHFPQFCGADVRVYKQKPFRAPQFPISPIQIQRTPKLDKSKCKYANKSNGEIRSLSPGANLEKYFEFHEDCSSKCHSENCSISAEQEMVASCEIKVHRPCDTTKTGCCKENVEKPISPGELVGYGEPLSPGEIRILETADKYGEATIFKHDSTPLKENALKTCQVHLNGSHTESSDFICHRVAMDIILDHPVLNHKKLKLSKMRVKKKKKKKKKLKDILNENMQGKCESLQLHKFKLYKTELQNKLYLTKKRVKHKKHKSGKKSVSKKVISKKRKTIASSSAGPEFQLVCTNLDELRELIKKIDGELKGLENNKKKSEKWHFRKQGVKELHSTLIRLLNELLPWEPKLLKAFQRNRARLKKDYDDFKKQPDFEHVTRESCSREESEANKSPNPAMNTCDIDHQEILKQDHLDNLLIKDMEVSGKGKSPKKDLLKSPSKSCKRQWKPHICTDNEPKGTSPRKKVKLSTFEVPSKCLDGQCNAKDNNNIESDAPLVIQDSLATSLVGFEKGTKPIQALLAKTIGNKVALTSQLVQSFSKNASCSESSVLSPADAGQSKLLLSCQTPSQNPLKMIYKMPGIQCISAIDLQSSSLKFQMQPVIDSKTGEKVMQQVLLLPKNLFIQHIEENTTTNVSQSLSVQQCLSNAAPSVHLTDFASSDTTTQHTQSLCNKSVVNLTKPLNFMPQPSVATSSSSVSVSQCESKKSSCSVLTTNILPTLVSSVMPLSVQPDHGRSILGPEDTLANMQNTTTTTIPRDVSEAKQELKTVCIRDSQSILVRTRGGNTGVVKVQTSQDQSSSLIRPNSIFTFTPQLQSFLVSKSKTSTSSTFTSPSSVAPVLLPCFQSSPGLSPISPPIPVSCGLTKEPESNTKHTQNASTSNGVICQVVDKNVKPSNFLSTVPAASSWAPRPHGKMDITPGFESTLSYSNTGQGSTVIAQAVSDIKQNNLKASTTVQPDSTTPPNTDLKSGAPLQKVMFFSSPPILSPGNATKINLVTTTPSSANTTQKLIFINSPVPTASSSSSLALQTTKQASPSLVGKSFVKTGEQPQIILIPSTMGSSAKMNSTPIVSQVKDVKIGLTIGQTIVNSSSIKRNIMPINIVQNTTGKAEENSQNSFAVSKTSSLVQVVQNGSHGIGYDGTVSRSKDVVTCADVPSTSTVSTWCNAFDRNHNDILRPLPALSNRVNSTTVGNTVAISTVKTGHLSSSVLLSTTQMSGHVKSVLSNVPLPHSSTGVSSQIMATPGVPAYQMASKEIMEKVQFPSLKFPKLLGTNIIRPQLAPLSASTMSKSGPVNSESHGPTQILKTSYVPSVNQPKAQFNDSCIHQKIVLNTSTPLAPGTQITINDTRFIVPPQGLGVGSHVLLIATNAKQGLFVSGNSTQVCQNIQELQTPLKQSISSIQTANQSFSISKTIDSVSTNSVVHAVPHTINPVPKDVSIPSALPVDKSTFTCPQPITGLQSLLLPTIQRGSILPLTRHSAFPNDIPVKDGGILNPMNSLVNRAVPPSTTISENKNADTALATNKLSMQHTQ